MSIPAENPRDPPDVLEVFSPFGGARTARSRGLRRSLAVPLSRYAGDICGIRSKRRSSARMQDRDYRRKWCCGAVLRGRAGRFHGRDRARSGLTLRWNRAESCKLTKKRTDVTLTRRKAVAGAVALATGYGAYRSVPVVFRPRIEFEPLDEPRGFRRIAGGKISTGFAPFAGISSNSAPDPLLERAARIVNDDICGALFGASKTDSDVVRLASFSDYYCPYCRVQTKRPRKKKPRRSGVSDLKRGKAETLERLDQESISSMPHDPDSAIACRVPCNTGSTRKHRSRVCAWPARVQICDVKINEIGYGDR